MGHVMIAGPCRAGWLPALFGNCDAKRRVTYSPSFTSATKGAGKPPAPFGNCVIRERVINPLYKEFE